MFFGSIGFTADDSVWLPEAPMDGDSLPVRSNTHFLANNSGVLILQELVPYRVVGSLAIRHHRKSSSKPHLHHASRRLAVQQVMMVHPSDSLHNIFESISEDEESCGSLNSVAEVFMVGTP